MFIGLLPEYKNNQLELSMMTQAYAQFYDYEDDFSCSQCHNPLCTGNCYGPTSGCSACGSRDCNGSCMDVCSQCATALVLITVDIAVQLHAVAIVGFLILALAVVRASVYVVSAVNAMG